MRLMLAYSFRFCCVLVAIVTGLTAPAQDLVPVSDTYAITGATIIPMPGQKIENGTVIVQNGLIIGVGKNINIPADAIIIKADSMFVYAGFIDGYSHVGVNTGSSDKKEKVKYPGNPPPERAGINPHIDVRDFINPSDANIAALRAQGFTVSQVVPHGNMLPGQAAVVLLKGEKADRVTINANSALYSELSGTPGVYPSTIMGVMAKWRELYRQAAQTKNYQTLYASNPTGLERPEADRILEAFYPVIDRRQSVLFKSEKVLETQRALSLKSDLGLQVMLGDLKEGWPIVNKIKNSGAKVFLSLDLPAEMKKDDNAEKKSEERKALDKRKADAIASSTSQAAQFAKAGIEFGFSTNSVKPADVRPNLMRMIASGLPEETALAALTTKPAQMLGLSNRLGTVENGKIANLVITDAPYFDKKSKVKYVLVEGTLFSVEDRPKNDNGKKADVKGSWSYQTETPQGKGDGKLVIKNENGNYSGTITNSFSGKETDVKDLVVSGNNMSFNYTIDVGGSSLKVEVAVAVKGDSLEGSMTAGQYGTFPLNGTRDPK